ncbi:Rieske 2Fe-2S domain-containing protein [Paraburkholderia sp.]|uniref:Rieske 2Fe-2S domain-containing protein n=1 Tax=Paraburkholderia sp. TaxID=1926495 RepID=UPI003C7A34F6
MADETTPLIRDCWYVAAASKDVTVGALFARRLLDVNVVLFRKSDGTISALRDRCAHRSYPLSQGKIEADSVVCGYHGFRYDGSGMCTQIPSLPGKCPQGISVQSYPVVEKRPFIWIWMGDQAKADVSTLPSRPWMEESDEWGGSDGYLRVGASYVHLHENLLDLTHLSFLHEKTFGTPDYASAPSEFELGEATFAVLRTVAPTTLPAVYARTTGITGANAARIVKSTFISPALHLTEIVVHDRSIPVGQRRDFHLRTAQIITPESSDALHYHFAIKRDFAIADVEMSDFIIKSIKAAFDEDVHCIETIAKLKREEADADFYEHPTYADKAGIEMRRHLKRRADAECAGRARDSAA